MADGRKKFARKSRSRTLSRGRIERRPSRRASESPCLVRSRGAFWTGPSGRRRETAIAGTPAVVSLVAPNDIRVWLPAAHRETKWPAEELSYSLLAGLRMLEKRFEPPTCSNVLLADESVHLAQAEAENRLVTIVASDCGKAWLRIE